jgi:arabinose-5-phosphate isomerase
MRNGAKDRALETLKAEEQALKSLRKALDKTFVPAISILSSRAGRIIVSGIGKSGFIGMKIAATLTSLGQQATFLHPVEAIHGDLGFVSPGDVVIVISFSGESSEVIKLVKYLRRDFSVQVISITKSPSSTIGKLSDAVIEVPVKTEGSPHGVAPMASTTATLVIGDMIASALTSPKDFKKDQFARLHPGGGLSLTLNKVKDFMMKGNAVPRVADSTSFSEALKVMSDKKLGTTGVVDKRGKLVGIVTDGDIRRYLISTKFDPEVRVSQVMTKNPKTITSESTLKEALELMEKYRITTLFVKNSKDKIEGIIHIHNIVEGNIV